MKEKIMLLLRSKKTDSSAAPLTDEELIALRGKKRKRTIIITAAVIILLIAAIKALPMLTGKSEATISAEETLVSGTAETGSIASVFTGSGALTDAEAEDVTIVSSVKLLSYTVKNGESVKKGDAIAKVDKSTVQAAAAELQDAIDEIDAEIQTASTATVNSSVWSRADGLVKEIYAQSGDKVLDVMYEHGALMLISLDGLMAVDIQANDNMNVRDPVLVTLPDGTEVSGYVYHISKGIATVTISDRLADKGTEVTVSDESGIELGQGELYIHSELKLSGFTGTVNTVFAADESYIYNGQTLLTLTDTDYDGDYQRLISKREDYAREMDRLMAMYQEGYVYAEEDGIISGIPEGSDYTALSAGGESGGIVLLRESSLSGGGIVLLSSDPQTGDPPVTTSDPPVVSSDPPVVTSDPPDIPVSPSPSLPADGTHLGAVSSVSYGGLTVSYSAADAAGTTNEQLAAADSGSFTESYTFTVSGSVSILADGVVSAGSISDIRAGDLILFSCTAGDITSILCYHPQTQQPGGNTGDMAGGMAGGAAGGDMGGSASAESSEPSYTLAKTIICGIVPVEKMTVIISVDELDVLSLAIGQKAVVTLDAVSGKSFAGTVTELDPTGSNEGGGTKYSITLTIDRTAEMLSGMNASASITISGVENALLIPQAAVFEEGNKSYVYTGCDEKSGQPTSPVEVTTGASDGVNVQILSGLEPGDSYYYMYAASMVYKA